MSEKNKEFDDIARSVWLFGLGTVATIEEEAKKIAQQLKESSESTARTTIDDVVKKATEVQQEIQAKVDSTVQEAVNFIGIPTQTQVTAISLRIDELTKKVEALTRKAK